MKIFISKHLRLASSVVGQSNITPQQMFRHIPESFRYDDMFVQHNMSSVLRVMTQHECTRDTTRGQIRT